MASTSTDLRMAAVASLDALEAEYAGQYACPRCFDWGTVVLDKVDQPCPACRAERWKVWRLGLSAAAVLVAVPSVSQLCEVVLPALYESVSTDAQRDGGRHCAAAVLVRSVAGGEPWFAELCDLEIVEAPANLDQEGHQSHDLDNPVAA